MFKLKCNTVEMNVESKYPVIVSVFDITQSAAFAKTLSTFIFLYNLDVVTEFFSALITTGT